MITVYFYTKTACPLCDEAKWMLEMFQDEYGLQVEERDIYTNDQWLEQYQLIIPCIQVNGEILDASQLSWESLKKFLEQYARK
ncbi:hypothetical protein J32TS6_38140 [Virgibacillus pantothenticus]|uniref:glutaredoxin family protein n=1 Tax=Virgibacillus TaxID=84406 RepID=UPI000956D5DB|nr:MULTISPECIES: glutaredoxin family protein [Virgibacillus]MEB5450260.1 glutaredoxin family protein [Virgibacillus pantothenticus]MEB5455937.1 glutaredoxin family protein [Virgibacillus pantothenticus]MEB5459798.1 glutaredoxin family protein [Virgibacillus pantothenticus]MEB5464380.1 glutaredoxin family protein [Virgibacillus pantothenticus]MEB5468708.1 glutaredoxin family protein [Virgibacillus pantothenticus]